MNVHLVIRDDGNSQEAEESVDSVWLLKGPAKRRAEGINDARGVRVESRPLRLRSAAADWNGRTFGVAHDA